MEDWKDEIWFDVRKLELLKKPLEKRISKAKELGCHAIEYDNVDCWQNKCVKDKKQGDKEMFNWQLTFNIWLAETGHKYGLAVGLKNDLD